ncbi:unnamed protein product, partial [Acanthocheilonema viteae]
MSHQLDCQELGKSQSLNPAISTSESATLNANIISASDNSLLHEFLIPLSSSSSTTAQSSSITTQYACSSNSCVEKLMNPTNLGSNNCVKKLVISTNLGSNNRVEESVHSTNLVLANNSTAFVRNSNDTFVPISATDMIPNYTAEHETVNVTAIPMSCQTNGVISTLQLSSAAMPFTDPLNSSQVALSDDAMRHKEAIEKNAETVTNTNENSPPLMTSLRTSLAIRCLKRRNDSEHQSSEQYNGSGVKRSTRSEVFQTYSGMQLLSPSPLQQSQPAAISTSTSASVAMPTVGMSVLPNSSQIALSNDAIRYQEAVRKDTETGTNINGNLSPLLTSSSQSWKHCNGFGMKGPARNRIFHTYSEMQPMSTNPLQQPLQPTDFTSVPYCTESASVHTEHCSSGYVINTLEGEMSNDLNLDIPLYSEIDPDSTIQP